MSAGVHLRGLSTAVPPTILPQPAVRDVFKAQPGLNRLAQRIIGTTGATTRSSSTARPAS